jgi:drug/metabolite transporter (DMT)-like permease
MTSTTSPQTNLSRGYAVALISALILSTTAIFIRHLTETYQMPALVLAFWRDLIVSLTLLPILVILRPGLLRVQRDCLAYLLAYGLLLAAFNGVWTLSVAVNGAAISTVLVYSSAAFTALLGWWFLKEGLNWGKVLAIVLSLGGCVLVSGALRLQFSPVSALGVLIGILSGLAFAVYTLMGRSASQRGLNPWTTLLYTFGFAAVFLLIFNLLPLDGLPGKAATSSDLLWLGSAWVGWVILFLLAAGPTLAGFGLYNVSLSYLPSSVVNLIVTLEPVFTAILAYLFLGEIMNAAQITGGILILAGVVFLRLFGSRRSKPAVSLSV